MDGSDIKRKKKKIEGYVFNIFLPVMICFFCISKFVLPIIPVNSYQYPHTGILLTSTPLSNTPFLSNLVLARSLLTSILFSGTPN